MNKLICKMQSGEGNLSKKAFTLIELMGVIILLGIIALIAIPIVDGQLKEGRKDLSKTQITNIKEAVQTWGAANIYNLPENGDNCYLKYSTLVDSGYLDDELKELSSNEFITDINLKIEISKDENYNKYNYLVEFNKDGYEIPDKYCNAKYEYSNLVKNGSFEEKDDYYMWLDKLIGGTRNTNYSKFGSSSLYIESTSSDAEKYVYLENTNNNSVPLILNHKYYFSIYSYQTAYIDNSYVEFYAFYTPNGQNTIVIYPRRPSLLPELNKWNKNSLISVAVYWTGIYPINGIRIDFDNANVDGSIYYDGYLIVDLTETFGAGNEPDKAWCDENLNYIDYGKTSYAYYK